MMMNVKNWGVFYAFEAVESMKNDEQLVEDI